MTNALNDFSKVTTDYYFNKNKNCFTRNRAKVNLYNGFKKFAQEFNSYTISITNGKNFNHRQLADCIFLAKFSSLNQYQQYLKKSLFSANAYLLSLDEKITKKNVDKYFDSLQMIRIDFEELVASIEVNVVGSSTSMTLMSGRKKFKDLIDIWGIARNLFFIEDFEQASDLHYYDIKPFSVFAIRQTIEQYGKEVLGYTSITDPNGQFSKKHLYSSWEFIKIEMAKSSSRITLPFDLEVMLKIEKWSHRFVHAGYYADCYIIWQALDMMGELFRNDGQYKRIYTGQRSKRTFGDVLITNYDSLKVDFLNHLNSNISDSSKHVIANWIDVKSVKPYIISL